MDDLASRRRLKMIQLLRARDTALRHALELRSTAAQTVRESKQAIVRARQVCGELQRIRAEIGAVRARAALARKSKTHSSPPTKSP